MQCAFEKLEVRELFTLALREKEPAAMDDLLKHYPSMYELADITVEEIQNVTGLSAAKARQLRAILELARRYALPPSKPNSIKCPADIAAMLMPDMAYLDREVFKSVLLDTKHCPIHIDTVAVGGLSSCHVAPREVFKEAIRRSAAAVILTHNHPSGDSTPSSEDVGLTRRLVAVGEIIGISVLDHIIIGRYGYASLREQGYITD